MIFRPASSRAATGCWSTHSSIDGLTEKIYMHTNPKKKPPPDFSLHEKAAELRASGLIWREVGAKIGVTDARARELAARWQRIQAAREAIRNRPPSWHDGLSDGAVRQLLELNISSRDSCMVYASNSLAFKHGFVLVPGPIERNFPEKKWDAKYQTPYPWMAKSRLSVVNEIRAWLGVEPLEPPSKMQTDAEVGRAMRVLAKAGYKVIPNK